MGRSQGRHGGVAGEEAVLALVAQHAGDLLRFARRFSACADDAQDAYQRALEKLVRRLRTEPPEHVLPWLRTVLRHEAQQVRAERERAIGPALPFDEERDADGEQADPAERVERFERLACTAEALRGLKPQELTALVLRAEGLSYREICERTQWSYTRLNRCLSEGRRSLTERMRAIESGAECERWLPLLSRFADGEATAKEVTRLRPHLRRCAGCRATVRGFHAVPRQLGVLLPIGLVPGVAAAAPASLSGPLEAFTHGLLDRAGGAGLRLQGALDRTSASARGTHGGLAEQASASAARAHGGLVERASASAVRAHGGLAERLTASAARAHGGVVERATTAMLRVQSAIDALPAAKLAAVAASTVAVASGGVAIEQAATAGPRRAPAEVIATGPQGGADGAATAAGAQATAGLRSGVTGPSGVRSSAPPTSGSGTDAAAAAAGGEFAVGARALFGTASIATAAPRSPAEWPGTTASTATAASSPQFAVAPATVAGDTAAGDRADRDTGTDAGAGVASDASSPGDAADAGSDASGPHPDSDASSPGSGDAAGAGKWTARRPSASSPATAPRTAPAPQMTAAPPTRTAAQPQQPAVFSEPASQAAPSDTSAAEFGGS